MSEQESGPSEPRDEAIDFTKAEDGDGARSGSWGVTGVAELELSVDVGRITVHLDEAGASEVRVHVRHDPTVGGMLTQGISTVVSRLSQAVGGPGSTPSDIADEAVQACEITWSEAGRRLVVRSSQELPLRVVPLDVTVSAPAGSRVAARTGAGDVEVTGTAGWAAVRTGSGRIGLGAVDGDADATTGSGDIAIGDVSGRARLRTGSGAIRVAGLGGTTDIKSGSGDIEVGRLAGDLGARTGSGDLRIADARSGRVDVTTGSGELRVAVHPGVRAELDLSSGSGRARSELDVAGTPPEESVALQVHGRTGSGDVLVTRALVGA